MNERDLTKLPKWAQLEIERLRRDNDDYAARFKLVGGETESNIEIGDMMDSFCVGERSRVKFKLPNGYIECHFNHDRDAVDIYAHHSLIIEPRASNTCRVRDGGR
jgi:hypothetical protein